MSSLLPMMRRLGSSKRWIPPQSHSSVTPSRPLRTLVGSRWSSSKALNDTDSSPPEETPASSSSVSETGEESQQTSPDHISVKKGQILARRVRFSEIPGISRLRALPRAKTEACIPSEESLQKLQNYPIHQSSLDSFRMKLAALLNTDFEKILKKLPSQSSRVIVLSSPFKGSDTCLDLLTQHMASQLNVGFIRLRNEDIFPQKTGAAIVAGPPLLPDDLSHPSSSNSLKRLLERQTSNPGFPFSSLGALGQPSKSLSRAGKKKDGAEIISVAIPMGVEIHEMKTSESQSAVEPKHDVPFIPYPWGEPYVTPNDELMVLPVPRIKTQTTSQPLPDTLNLIQLGIRKTIRSIAETNKGKNVVLFYSDLMRLISSDNSDTLIQTLVECTKSAKDSGAHIVLVVPCTTTFQAPHEMEESSASSSPSSSLNDIKSKLQSMVDGMHSSEDEPSGIDFSTPFDKYLGISVVNIYPQTEKQASKKFEELLKQDAKDFYRATNVKALEAVAKSVNSQLDLSKLPSDTILEEGFLSQNSLEELVLMAVSTFTHEPATESPQLDGISKAVTTLSEYQHQRDILEKFGSSTFLSLFHDPKDATDLTKEEEKIMKLCLVTDRPQVRIAGLSKVRQLIKEVIYMPLKHPEIFKRGILRESTTGILLFGPPGTGKTLLAKSVASESGANFLNVQMSHINSKWVGESEKNVRALFSLARKLKPCVIFVDEIDALLKARHHGQASYVTNTLNEFMSSWDGILSDPSGIIVVGATNRPFDLDDAVLRRLPRRILVNFPSQEERLEIVKVLLQDDVLETGLVEEVAQMTNGFSGSDLKNLCIAAALNSIREELTHDRVLKLSHFKKAIESGDVVPSLHERATLMKELDDWNKLYGTGMGGYNRGTSSHWGFRDS